jgi:RNA polymerase sigma factor (sigma-70 family)
MESLLHTSPESLLALYFTQLQGLEPLSAATERRLAGRIQDGDKHALQRLVLGNLRAALELARRYQREGIEPTDLYAAAALGLLNAAKRYKPAITKSFFEHASWYVRQELLAESARIQRPVSLPPALLGEGIRLKRRIDRLEQKLGRPLLREEVAELLELPLEQVEEQLGVVETDISLDSPVGEGDETMSLVDTISYEDDEPVDEAPVSRELREYLDDALEALTERERLVLSLEFGIAQRPLTQGEIAEKLSLSSEKLRQIRKSGLAKLRALPRLQRMIG